MKDAISIWFETLSNVGNNELEKDIIIYKPQLVLPFVLSHSSFDCWEDGDTEGDEKRKKMVLLKRNMITVPINYDQYDSIETKISFIIGQAYEKEEVDPNLLHIFDSDTELSGIEQNGRLSFQLMSN